MGKDPQLVPRRALLADTGQAGKRGRRAIADNRAMAGVAERSAVRLRLAAEAVDANASRHSGER